ncbi:unnamed protein product, partial [Symbiodinium pilosum]
DEIAIELGVNAEFATTLAQQLESGTLGALAPAENGSSPEAAASASSPDKADNKPATPAKGSDLEVVMSGESTTDFVKEWVQAANAAGGQSVRICAECLSSIFYDKYNLQLDQDMFLIELAHAELQFLCEAGSA